MSNPLMARWPSLWTFFGAYLNQEFGEEYGTPQATVQAFVTDVDTAMSREAAREARELLGSTSEDEARATMLELGLGYAFWVDGWTGHGWLKELARQLESV